MDSMARFSDSFLMETGKLLEEFSALLLAHESAKRPARADVDKMFRIVHTIKGSVGMMNLNAFSALTHALEELFVLLKKGGELSPSRATALFDLLFESHDAMRAALDDFARDGGERRSFDALIAKIKAFRELGDELALRVALTPDCAMENVRAFLIVSTLKGLCPSLTYDPPALDSDENASQKIRRQGLLLRYPASYDQAIREALQKELYIAQVARTDDFSSVADAPAEAGEPAGENAAAESYVSVRLAKLDALQRLTDEMLLKQDELMKSAGVNASCEAALRAARLTDLMRSAVVSLRMTPVNELFQKLHRTAREAARKMKREVEFVSAGADVEIDKSILDGLSESLVQIVRNAVVHGVEDAKERLAAGKPLMGKVSVRARNAGTSVVISVTDDGRGVSAGDALRAARSAGLAPPEAPDTPEKLLELIMRPGVSTSAHADELSGRGVGLDVVRTAVEKMRGSVTMETREGAGATFTVRIPQSLVMMDCLCFEVGATIFLLPRLDVYRLTIPCANDVASYPDGRLAYRFSGHNLPLIDLGRLYRLRREPADGTTGVVAVLEGENNAVAVYADRLLAPKKAAIRPLPPLLEKLAVRAHGIASLTILNENKIGLILDAETLLTLQGGE